MSNNDKLPDALDWLDRPEEDDETEIATNLDTDGEPRCEEEEDGQIITCWCGAKGTYDELFDDSDAEGGCGGLGVIQCQCGGDICVCHHHGEYECPGCDDGWDYGDDWTEDD